MVVDATRAFRIEVAKLDRGDTSPELRQKVSDWYVANFMPDMTRIFGEKAALPITCPLAPLHITYNTAISSPIPNRGSDAICSTMPATAAITARCTQSIIRSCAPPPRRWASQIS